MSNLIEVYIERIYPIEDVVVGMQLRIGEYIGTYYQNEKIYDFGKGTVGIVTVAMDCPRRNCDCPRNKTKSCYNRFIIVNVDSLDRKAGSCHHKLYTLDGMLVGGKK